MKLLIMFAEMERKNIKLRVKDNYYARGEKGFYLGGYPPFAYKKVDVKIEGKKTCGYEIVPKEAETVREIYEKICFGGATAGGICRELNRRKIPTRRGGGWSSTTLIRLVRNPFYVKADSSVYDYIIKSGGKITSESDRFCGTNGIICYGKPKEAARFISFEGCTLTVGKHEGIVNSALWLKAREVLSSGQKFPVSQNPKTYLSGKLYCGDCQKKLTTTSAKGIIYFYCRNKKSSLCIGKAFSIRGDFLEEIIEKVITERISELSCFKKPERETSEKTADLCEISRIEANISAIKKRLEDSDEVEFTALLETRLNLERKLTEIRKRLSGTGNPLESKEKLCYNELKLICENFGGLSFAQKKAVLNEAVERIEVFEKKIIIYIK